MIGIIAIKFKKAIKSVNFFKKNLIFEHNLKKMVKVFNGTVKKREINIRFKAFYVLNKAG